MTQILILLFYLALAFGLGRNLLSHLSIVPSTRLQSFAYSAPIGLGVIAYGVLAIGLLGLLTSGGTIGLTLLLCLLAWPRRWSVAKDIHAATASELSLPKGDAEGDERPAPVVSIRKRRRVRLEWWLAGITLAVSALIVLVNCFVPPSAHEWDAISYHLAVPKIYLQNHRIVFLPTDHHSNFPFTMEMLFTLGLMFGGYALANLFHLACGALCVAALFEIGRRRNAGWLAAGAFATSPIVLWEAGAAYIEMGLAMFVITAFGAAMKRGPGWIVLAGILMGFALSVKALALVPFVLLGFLLWRQRKPGLKWYFIWAIVVGCPFYVKCWVQTGNPVYPFAYRLFGGKYWSTELADAYAGEQRSFGQNAKRTGVRDDLAGNHPEYSKPTPIQRITNLALAPFELISVPRVYYNYNDPGVRSQLGFLFLPLALVLLIAPRLSRAAKAGGWLVLLWFVVWSQSMQYVRYLIPLLAILAATGSESVSRLGRKWKPLRYAALAALVLQAVVSLAFFAQALPDQWARATNAETREAFLKSTVRIYESQEWLNKNAPPDTGVVLFEETRGFFLDRPYLWGNSPHSLYIPYPTMRTGAEMASWFLDHKVQFALLNLQFAPQATASVEGARMVPQAAATNSVAGLTLEWYSPESPGEPWRHLLGDALRTGAALVRSDGSFNGAVIIEFRRSSVQASRSNDPTTQRPNDPTS